MGGGGKSLAILTSWDSASLESFARASVRLDSGKKVNMYMNIGNR